MHTLACLSVAQQVRILETYTTKGLLGNLMDHWKLGTFVTLRT